MASLVMVGSTMLQAGYVVVGLTTVFSTNTVVRPNSAFELSRALGLSLSEIHCC